MGVVESRTPFGVSRVALCAAGSCDPSPAPTKQHHINNIELFPCCFWELPVKALRWHTLTAPNLIHLPFTLGAEHEAASLSGVHRYGISHC